MNTSELERLLARQGFHDWTVSGERAAPISQRAEPGASEDNPKAVRARLERVATPRSSFRPVDLGELEGLGQLSQSERDPWIFRMDAEPDVEVTVHARNRRAHTALEVSPSAILFLADRPHLVEARGAERAAVLAVVDGRVQLRTHEASPVDDAEPTAPTTVLAVPTAADLFVGHRLTTDFVEATHRWPRGGSGGFREIPDERYLEVVRAGAALDVGAAHLESGLRDYLEAVQRGEGAARRLSRWLASISPRDRSMIIGQGLSQSRLVFELLEEDELDDAQLDLVARLRHALELLYFVWEQSGLLDPSGKRALDEVRGAIDARAEVRWTEALRERCAELAEQDLLREGSRFEDLGWWLGGDAYANPYDEDTDG
ncbi:MAG: hypothetical protein AAFU79_01455 [Myxococcota bacterium]